MMTKLKKKLILLAFCSGLPLFLVAIVVGIVDPFFVYHAPLEGLYYTIDNQLEQNPGIAKHFEYNNVMLGSSMTTNFDTFLFDEQLGGQMVKLSYNAAYPKDIDKIMQIVISDKRELEHVFLCIDIANYMYTPGTLSYAYPEHLYDNNVLNDLKYLLNKEVLFDYIIDSYLGKKEIALNEIYWHWQYMEYSREKVLANYVLPQISGETSVRYTMDNLKANLDQCIIPYIEATSNTQWHIFFPPYSMLYWNDSMVTDEADIKVDGMAYITQQMLEYDNVEVYYFQDVQDWIGNLDNYTDTTHFSKEVTDEMTLQLCDDENRVTLDTYEKRIEMFRAYVKNYDYEALCFDGE